MEFGFNNRQRNQRVQPRYQLRAVNDDEYSICLPCSIYNTCHRKRSSSILLMMTESFVRVVIRHTVAFSLHYCVFSSPRARVITQLNVACKEIYSNCSIQFETMNSERLVAVTDTDKQTLNKPPFPSNRHHRSSGDCLEGKRENYQVCSVQYCVQQLYTVNCTHI